MASPGFYNVNRNRSYPFRTGTVDQPIAGPLTLLNLPDDAVVDAGFMMGVQSGFDPLIHSIRLRSITRIGNTFIFEFVCDAPALSGASLYFTRQVDDPLYVTEFSEEGTPVSQSSFSGSDIEPICRQPLWSGFMVSGTMESLDLVLPGNGVLLGSTAAALLEPALVQNLANAFVEAVNLANDDRTRATAPTGCPPIVFPFETGVTHVRARCLLGQVPFKAGFNATVRQRSTDNSITFGAAVGAGEGQPCGDVPLFPGEVPPPGSQLLEGGPLCGETLRSINGIGGPIFNFFSGVGVTFTPIPEKNRLVITVTLLGLALCFSSTSKVSESL